MQIDIRRFYSAATTNSNLSMPFVSMFNCFIPLPNWEPRVVHSCKRTESKMLRWPAEDLLQIK